MRPLVAMAVLSCVGCHEAHRPDPADAGAPFRVDAAVARDAGADPLWVEDTLGWRVRFVCTETRCDAPGRDAPADYPVDCGAEWEPYVASSVDGRVLTLGATCGTDGGFFGFSELWRPVVCRSDEACRRLAHVADAPPRCREGLCQVPEHPVRWSDVVAFCLARVPRPPAPLRAPDTATERAHELADAYCPLDGDSCEIPDECRWAP